MRKYQLCAWILGCHRLDVFHVSRVSQRLGSAQMQHNKHGMRMGDLPCTLRQEFIGESIPTIGTRVKITFQATDTIMDQYLFNILYRIIRPTKAAPIDAGFFSNSCTIKRMFIIRVSLSDGPKLASGEGKNTARSHTEPGITLLMVLKQSAASCRAFANMLLPRSAGVNEAS